MTEKFTKDNDYTISVITESSIEHKSENAGDKIYQVSSLTKTFNFLSAQVTMTRRDSIFQSRNTQGGGSASVSTQMIIQNFRDIQSYAEIKLMHQKLRDLDGKPPELSEVLPILNKKPSPLQPE